jgi:alkane 1-monooxygenase
VLISPLLSAYYAVSSGNGLWLWFSFLGAALSAGIMAASGVNLGHDLGHKVNDTGQQLAAQLALALPTSQQTGHAQTARRQNLILN